MDTMSARTGKTTIRDVASAAGVSAAAVSKVLHGSRSTIGVSEVRAREIRAVAERLNYVPNLVARNLRSGRTGDIGLVFEGLGGLAEGPRYHALALDGIAEVLFARGYRFTVIADASSADAVASLYDGRLDGAIWCRFNRRSVPASISAGAPIPIVALNAPHASEGGARASVLCDNAGGARAVAEHFFALGHRRCAFVEQDAVNQAPDAVARLESFRATLAELGAEPPPVVRWNRECEEFAAFHSAHPEITAYFAWSEGAAGQILLRAEDAGISIPDAVSVAGFDSTSYCETTRPPLTAVRQPIGEMAREAARLLLGMIDGSAPERAVRVYDCPLDVRRSTGPAPHSPFPGLLS